MSRYYFMSEKQAKFFEDRMLSMGYRAFRGADADRFYVDVQKYSFGALNLVYLA